MKEFLKGFLRGALWAIIISVTYLYGCSGTPATTEIDPYVKQFETEVGVKVENVNIYFTKLKKPAVGRCFPCVKIIQIDLEHYKNSSRIEQKALVFHELGHCVCNIFKHAKEGSFCGRSLMIPAMMSKWCYDKFWDVYVEDLKARCK